MKRLRSSRAWPDIIRFPDPLPMGSGSGVQCLPKLRIFLFGLAQHKIGFGWESMAHMRRCQIEVQVESGRRPKSKMIF